MTWLGSREAKAQVDARYSAVQGWLLDTVLAISLFATLAAMISANLGSDRGPQVVPYLRALMLGSLIRCAAGRRAGRGVAGRL
ncbi:hypothetical protein ACO0LV_15100 [Pseudactinotalea sp. Z1739]|uniref:hypothetical protein n=1 Tax=Pseudactinotalea sp. Z1739 TaxID=3413028 RepID=UPI003C7B6FCC